MKISLNWIKQFTDITVPVDELVRKIGSQLGEVDEVIHLGEAYKDVVIAKVVKCEKHPNADKLSVCLLDDGRTVEGVERKDGLVQVVCGAPNVAEGQMIAWLPPGSIVPETFNNNDQFKLDSRELRGVVSNGMIASQKELALGDAHEGILEITDKVKPGDSFSDVFDLTDEVIVDIENKMFTHRPDCFGILGVAREIAGIQGVAFKSPESYLEFEDGSLKIEDKELPLRVDNQLPELVPRFMAVAMSGVQVKPSPLKIQSYLARVGLKPINNIVDITNMIMYLTAQPLHAFDYDKVAAANGGDAVIEVRKPDKDEEITLLNGKTIKPHDDAIMIATPKKLIGVGGAMGGSETEVGEDTKNIIIECANFDMYSIRRTSMIHGLFTDAVTRFNKGQSPLQNDRVLDMMIKDVKKNAGGSVASKVFDSKQELTINKPVEVSVEFINSRLGSGLSAKHITEMLKNVEFEVNEENGKIKVTPPFWRTDIHIPEDVVEEAGRLYGYDNLPKVLQQRSAYPQQRSKLLSFKQRLRENLAKSGANEVLTYSFVHEDVLKFAGQDVEQAYTITNALSPELQKYRLSLTPSLLSNVHSNIKAGHDEFALFEIGKTHNKKHLVEDDLPLEMETMALTYTRKKPSNNGAGHYMAKSYLVTLMNQLGLKFEFKKFESDPDFSMTAPFDLSRSAAVCIEGSDDWIGIVGEYKNSVSKKFKLPPQTAGFEISVFDLMKNADSVSTYKQLNKYPSTELDVTLQVADTVSFDELFTALKSSSTASAKEKNTEVTVKPLEAFKKDSQETVNYSFRLVISPKDKTITKDESVDIKSNMLSLLKVKFKEV